MGAASSTHWRRAEGDDGTEDVWDDRVWAEGVPFTLLHDDAFVAEKYQDLWHARHGGAPPEDLDGSLDMTGTDELPRDELERMADAARIKLFATWRGPNDGGSGPTTMTALDAMAGTPLDRPARAWVTRQQRRAKQCEIVRDHMARLAVRMETRARQKGLGPVVVDRSPGRLARPAGASSCSTLPGSSLFHVASLRMQLEMLKGFRRMGSELFEDGVLSLVETILEFPPFALHGSDKTNGGGSSTDAVLIDNVYRFCNDMLQAHDLTERHRDAVLVLLLSLGICSGRSAPLIEFVAGIVKRTGDHSEDPSLGALVGTRTLREWVDELLTRVEAYRVQYDLGTLKDESLVKQVFIKAIRSNNGTETDDGGSALKQHTHIATDGSYIYIWNLSEGLSKIGTGSNFTVAGRVYQRAPPQQYFEGLRELRTFQCGLYGTGMDATSLIQDFASNATRAYFEETILVALSKENQELSSKPRRLFVQLEKNCTRSRHVFDDHEKLWLAFTEEGFLEGVEVLSAFYGDFVILHDEALGKLSTTNSVGVLLDSALIETLLVLSKADDVSVSSVKELILLYSTSSRPQHVFLEKFVQGQTVSSFDDPGAKVYFSSMTLCGGQIYLSLLQPLVSPASSSPRDLRHEPRTLIRVSPVDLSVAGAITLSAGDADTAPGLCVEARVGRPLFTYVSEGLRLYEVELSAERFRVRVFGGLGGSKPVERPMFARSFDVDVTHIQCATFVNGFLEFLKKDLRVGNSDCVIPTFYTNGSNMCMLLPAQASDSKSKFEGFMFNCETGDFLSDDDVAPTNADDRLVKPFERTLPSSSCCFDAANNTIWVVNVTRGTLFMYKNSGRRIAMPDKQDGDLPPNVLSHAVSSSSYADRAALRVLAFVTKHAYSFVDDATGSESKLCEPMNPFSTEGDTASMLRLLGLAEHYTRDRRDGIVSDANLESLRCCLSLLQRVVTRSMDSVVPQDLIQFRSRIPKLLASIIHEDIRAQAVEGSSDDLPYGFGRRQLDLRVVSTASELSVQITHLVDTDLNSQLDHVMNLVRNWRNRDLSSSDCVVTVSLLRQLRKTIESTTAASAPSSSVVFERFESIWNELVDAKECVVRDDRNDGDDEMAINQELIAFITFSLQAIFVRSLEDAEALHLTLKIVKLVCGGVQTACTALTRLIIEEKKKLLTIEKTLLCGLVRQITPIVLVNTTLLLRGDMVDSPASDGASRSSGTATGGGVASGILQMEDLRKYLGKWLQTESTTLCDLFRSLNELAKATNAEAQTVAVSTVSRTTRTETMESAHEYANKLDVTEELRIPGATQITITFDPRSRTELSYDYVTFYKDEEQTSFYGEKCYSGCDAEFNWPGVGGRPPLVIDSDHCYVHFHTDRSNTDWGYKFTAVGELFKEASFFKRHWLASLTDMVVDVIDDVGRLLVEGTQLVPISKTEAQNDYILDSELLRHGISSDRERDIGVLKLLRDFADPAEDSDAAKVLHAMERESGKFRPRQLSKAAFGAPTGVMARNSINIAIRATTAAILHHNMCGMDAYGLAQNLRTDVSEQLSRGLKNAQKMRDWFHLGDAADVARSSVESPSTRSSRRLLQKQPSAYRGMSDVALETLSKNVVERANFLLEVTPMSFANVSGAKRRWDFLAKYGSALGVGSNTSQSRPTSSSTLGKWYSLLDELQEARELQNLLHYRKSSSERRKGGRYKSVTEQVLEFVQSDIDVQELRDLIAKRNERAAYRACGLWLYRNVSAASNSLELRIALAESCSTYLRKAATDAGVAVASLAGDSVTVLPSQQLHYGTFLSGCDGAVRKDVNTAFRACVHHFVGEMTDQSDTEYLVALLKSVCIDYEADDAHLLRGSSLLPQLVRLGASKASRVHRSTQVLQDLLLSRLGNISDSSTNGNKESAANSFQSQIFATVGLQLKGIVSQVRDFEGSRFRDREHNLGSYASGLTAPSKSGCDVCWNHSIMVWVYVASEVVSYSLKVDDKVRRGPSWFEREGEQLVENDGPDETGIVVAVTSPTSVRVKWQTKPEEENVEFDPKHGKLDAVLADESIGGVVFCKGTKNLLVEDTLAAPWSHFGLYLNNRRQLSYRVSCGPEKECVYDTNHTLPCNEWAHVAITQDEEILKFYVNGSLVSQQVLDPFLVLHNSFSASESRMVESVHPVDGSVDKYWPLHIPGASKIRVTFDPLSEIDPSGGFVRFYKNERCNEVWGEDKYLGRCHDSERNFPGALIDGSPSADLSIESQRYLEIPSDRFVVHLHHSGDTPSWGFRLLATPQFESARTKEGPLLSLNSEPFCFGVPPARVQDENTAKSWIYQPQVENTPLEDDAIFRNMKASCPTGAPREFPLERALYVIGLLQTSAETSRGRELIGTPENVGDLIILAFGEAVPVEVRCASVVVLKQLCSSLSAEFVAEQFKRVLPESAQSSDFVGFVFDALSKAVSVWSRCSQDMDSSLTDRVGGEYESADARSPNLLDLQFSATDSMALTRAYASLFRHLAQHSDWVEPVCRSVEAAMAEWKSLQCEAADPEHRNARWNDAAANITAALILLGGEYDGVSIGGRVKCCANTDSKGTTETGYLLRFHHKIPDDTNGGRKQLLRTARVLLDCDPVSPVDVPIHDVGCGSCIEDEEELSKFIEVLAPRIFGEVGVGLYTALLGEVEADLPSDPLSFKTKSFRKEKIEVIESSHPYASGENTTYPLVMNGVREIVIFFDEMSSTAGQNDYVSFVKRIDDNRMASQPDATSGKVYWGEERYYGKDFPGVRGAPPLRIPASSVDVHFHTESSAIESVDPSANWGFKVIAQAYEETVTCPPETPPSLVINAINDVRARALKSLHTCLRLLKPLPLYKSITASMSSLVSCVAKLANASDDGRPTQWPSRTQTFESQHPYTNSLRECTPVIFHGASRLKITFDPRTKTEDVNDNLTFFKDQSMTDFWGDKYSGPADSAKWPGIGGRPPLIISSNSFYLVWETDSADVDWGWCFTVTVEYPVMIPMSLRLDQLNAQAQQLWEIFYDGIGPQRRHYAEEYEGFATIEECKATQCENDPNRFLLLGNAFDDVPDVQNDTRRNFRVVEATGVDVFDSNAETGVVVGHSNAGEDVWVVEEKNEWLKIQTSGGSDSTAVSTEQWIKRRTDDKVHVIAVDTLLQNKDVVVVGVDDTPDFLAKLNDNLHLDDSNDEKELYTTFVSSSNVDALKGQSTRYQSLAYDTHRALAIKYARETLYLLVSTAETSRDSEKRVELRDFGSPSEFLLVLTHLFLDRDGVAEQNALERGLQHLLISSADEDSCALVDRCLGVLTASEHLLPSARGTMHTLESQHPYSDNVELYWQMSVPGAKRILVYFDPRTKTEVLYDYVRFYKNGTDRAEFHGESRYYGRNGSENWPGFGGRRPLVIDADNFEVHLCSDPYVNDWGFKLFAIGVFDENDSTGVEPLAEGKLEALVKIMKLCMWVLGVAARACFSTPDGLRSTLSSSLFSPRLIEVLRTSIQDHPHQVRVVGLQLLQQVTQNLPFVHSLPSSMVEALHARLMAKLRAQFSVEGQSETKSEYLKSLVECALFVDLATDSGCYEPRKADDSLRNNKLVLSRPHEQLVDNAVKWSTPLVPARDGILHFQFILRSVSGPVQVKLISHLSSGGPDTCNHIDVLLNWEGGREITTSSLCGPERDLVSRIGLHSGDTFSVYLDLERHVMVLRKNQVTVCSWEKVDTTNTLRDGGTLLSVVIVTPSADDSIAMEQLTFSPLASLPMATAPSWYNQLSDSVSLLLDFEERRESKIVECENKYTLQELEADNLQIARESVYIPGAHALEVRFDRRTALGPRHRVRFFANQEDGGEFEPQIVGIEGTRFDEYPALFLNDSTKRPWTLKAGDCVVRASDWCYGDEDGGPGSIGQVEEIVAWGGRNGCGIRVRWRRPVDHLEPCTGLYRYGYEDFFDVQHFQLPSAWDTPLVIPGDSLEYILETVGEETNNESSIEDGNGLFEGTLKIDPISASSALSLDVRNTNLRLGDECTVEFWIHAEDMAVANGDDHSPIFSLLEIATLDPNHGVFIGATSGGKFCVLTQAEQGIEELESTMLPSAVDGLVLDNQWVHVGVVFGSSRILLYANGVKVFEARLEETFLARNLCISALRFGVESASMGQTRFHHLRSHICDVRVWDVSLRVEQLHSHANGIDLVNPGVLVDRQTPIVSSTPSNQSRPAQTEQVLPVPQLPRSLSRSTSFSLTQREWVTANRTDKDLVTVRADFPIPATFDSEGKPTMIYFETHVLSDSNVCIGFVNVDAKPTSQQADVGDYEQSIGLELPRRRVHLGGVEALDLDDSEVLGSTRGRSSNSSSPDSGDAFSREGDVVGCGYVPSTKDFRFYVNGDLVAQIQLKDSNDDPSADHVSDIPSGREVRREFDLLVDEMVSMGFSRHASEVALETTSGTAEDAIPRAVEWLLEEGASLASSPVSSPRHRPSSMSSGAPSCSVLRTSLLSDRGPFMPVASLGALGAQGLAWNFGHRAFKYPPAFEGVVISAVSATSRQDADGDVAISFDIFGHSEAAWERVAHHHRVLELMPKLLALWKLDEGNGTTVYDSSGRGQIGTIESIPATTSCALSPRSGNGAPSWDANCVPPGAVTQVRAMPHDESRETTEWGYRFYVIPHFSPNSIGRRRFQTQAHRFIVDESRLEPRHDHQLIKYINKATVAKQLSLSQILAAPWHQIAPNEGELVKWPVLMELATGVPTSTSTDGIDAETRGWEESAKTAVLDRLSNRFKLLQELNSAVSRMLPFVAFSADPASSTDTRLDKLICDQRYRILHAVKRDLWDEALKRTTDVGQERGLTLNRPKAMRHRVSGKVDTEGMFTLFSQAFRHLNVLGGRVFRQSGRMYKVEFLGENAIDAGGPYRETLTQYADELHSRQLPLLIESSNAQHNVGAAREKWVLNPSARSATQLQMLEFLGKLMGASMRNQEYMSLRLALLVWKRLAGERVTTEDLALTDSMIVSSMDKIRSIDKLGVTAEIFEDIVLENFTTLSTDNRVVQLKPQGDRIAVTFDSRVEFADLVESYRLHEFDVQIEALRRGLAKTVPPRLLSLFTGAELEQLVCGVPEVDIDLLMKCTEYSSCSAEDDHIVWFWEVLRAFTHEERSAFLRFVWGRSRLPPSEHDFPQRFKLLSFSKTVPDGRADAYLPISHTCFFSVELPRYSSAEALREKLTYAMYNCQEIDGDGDSVAANQLGWED